jgi:hypothetical protein
MSEDVFDPARHKIVAIVAEGPEKGQHLHVTLAELARDAQQEFHRVDLTPLMQRIAALEAPAVAHPVPDPDLSAKVDACIEMIHKMAMAPAAFDPTAILEEIKAIKVRVAAQERAVQTILQAAADAYGREQQQRKAG